VNKPVKNPLTPAPLSPDLLRKMDAYWRAANYLTVGQIYLQDNPLLEKPLTIKLRYEAVHREQ
jgi:xylulose-5-phosphate/fructose-6-phosphate phosphoketolase